MILIWEMVLLPIALILPLVLVWFVFIRPIEWMIWRRGRKQRAADEAAREASRVANLADLAARDDGGP